MVQNKTSNQKENPHQTSILLLEIIRNQIKEMQSGQGLLQTVELDSSFSHDLGFDSLGMVELLSRAERIFNVSIPEQVLNTTETPRDLLREILRASGRKKTTLSTSTKQVEKMKLTKTPVKAGTLVEVLDHHLGLHGDRCHIRFYDDKSEGQTITYRELWEEATRVASGLQQFGLNYTETVLIMLPTGPDYFATFLGVLIAGGVPVPVYPPGHIRHIEEHLHRHTGIADNCLAAIMVTMPEAKQFSHLIHGKVATLRQILTIEEITGTGADAIEMPALSTNDIAFIQYTSGSTGAPKGVVLSHANLLANIRSMGKIVKASSNDVFVSWLPLYHDMGLIGAWLGSLYFGCQLVIMSPLSFIARPERWLMAIHRFGGTLSAAPNFAYELCLRRIEDHDIKDLELRTWRHAFNGAEAVSAKTINQFIKRFEKYGFRPETMLPVYGLAESSVGLTFSPTNRSPRIDRIKRQELMETGRAIPAQDIDDTMQEFVSCGFPLPGHQLRIADPYDRELPDRQEGRLQFQGPSATSGYFRNPQKTNELFHGQWLDSGDMAYIADGELFITGRHKDIIIRAGRNIYPVELEEAISQIEGIRKGNVAVFGSFSKTSGTEKLVVLAETRKRHQQALAALRTEINSIVAELTSQPPDDVVLAPPNTVLKTSSGKIRRAASREVYEQGLTGRPSRAIWLQISRFLLSGIIPRINKKWRLLLDYGYAGYCWGLFGTISPVIALLTIILPIERWRWSVLRVSLRLLIYLAGMRLQVEGQENIPATDSSYVFVSNHSSYLDGLALVTVLPHILSFTAKAELLERPIARILLSRLGSEFIDRFDPQKSIASERRMISKAKAGRSLFFFAEGTCQRIPGLLPFKLGAFEAAVRTNLPIVPIALRGTRSILRPDSWFPRYGSIKVIIGKPIKTDQLKQADEETKWSKATRLQTATRKWILENCGEPDLVCEPSTIYSSSPTTSE